MTRGTQLPELVGVYEIAHRLGVKVNTVQMWRRRDLGFPEPTQEFAMGPVWAWAQVDHWLEATGRHQEVSDGNDR